MGSKLQCCISNSSFFPPILQSSLLVKEVSYTKKVEVTKSGESTAAEESEIYNTPMNFIQKPNFRCRSYSTSVQQMNFEECFNRFYSKLSLENFNIIKLLNRDIYDGKVYLVSKKKNQEKLYVMNVCKKIKSNFGFSELFTLQKQIFDKKNTFLSKIDYLFDNKTTYYLFQKYYSDENLLMKLSMIGSFSENLAKFYIAELIICLENLPLNMNLVENLIQFLQLNTLYLDNEGHLMVDTLSILLRNSKKITEKDKLYNPPEFLTNEEKNSTFSSLFSWKIGILLYKLISGKCPFNNLEELKIINLKFNHKFSVNAKDFIRKLLVRVPKKRLGNNCVSELKNHIFFKEVEWENIIDKKIIESFEVKKDIPIENEKKFDKMQINSLKNVEDNYYLDNIFSPSETNYKNYSIISEEGSEMMEL